MLPEEPSSNTPQPVPGGVPPLSRADVAIGNLSQQLVRRTTSLPDSRPLQSPVVQPVQSATPLEGLRPDPVQLNLTVPTASVRPEPQSILPQSSSSENVNAQTPYALPPQNSEPQMAAPVIKQPIPYSPPALKKQNRVLVPALIMLAVILIGGSLFAWLNWQKEQNNPATIFSDALQASLTTTQLQATTVANNVGSTVDYDLSSPKNPLISSQETVSMFGSKFQLAGYGSAHNTYVSYTKFPAAISQSITSLATNGWVQLRSKGELPAGVNGTLADAADPRYQAIGLLTFGNFPQVTRTQLVNYLLTEHIYNYQAAHVNHMTLGGKKVIAYPVTLNINYLKIYDQSIATDEGFSPSDVQDAVTALNNWNGAHATFYVSATSHHFVRVSLNQAGQTTTISYNSYNKNSLPGEPETKLTWEDFAPVQHMIDQQAISHTSAAAISSQSKTVASSVRG